MNKKLLFAAMSLAILTACTNDEFESQKAAENVSPIQFEVINNDVVTRASMDGNKIVWNANDGDLFTLYHGGAVGGDPYPLTGYSNATYKANAVEGGTATLTTPSMITAGYAIMTWPVDTTFRATGANPLSIEVKETQGKDIENQIPYVSDLVEINPHTGTGTYNEAGYNRTYPVYMRPMASQLIIKADYAGTDADIKSLEAGEDGIDPISVTSVDLETGAATAFTKKINLAFTAKDATVTARWNAAEPHNNWSHVTGFDLASAVAATKLTTKCVTGNESAKFLMLPQNAIAVAAPGDGVQNAAVVINTTYGKVIIGAGGAYTAPQLADAWYRYQAPGTATVAQEVETAIAGTGSDAAKVRYTNNIALGLAQVINAFSNNTTTKATSIVKDEPTGAAGTRYVKVLLSKLDMSDLHVSSDKQLRDVVRVWKKMNLGAVTVYLDGDKTNHEFAISQKTIETINTINNGGLNFKVKPCREPHVDNVDDEFCDKIVITGADYKQDVQNIAFIAANENAFEADVVLAKEATAWKWNGTVKVTDAGVNQIINKGTMENAATAILATYENDGVTQNNVPFVNDGTWNINSGVLRVQFDVTNNSVITIKKNAQYRQDGQDDPLLKTTFTNERYDVPTRFGGDDTAVGTIWNYGTFATVGGGEIYNYGLIEHQDTDAKTYITANQTLAANGFTADADFGTAFNEATAGAGNKMGRINLPWNNKSEDNISINAALAQGFVSLTVDDNFTSESLSLAAGTIGDKVNYLKVNSASVKEITGVVNSIDYLEVEAPNEVAWNVTGAAYNFIGLMVLSDVNIKLNTTVNATVTYLGADMYVGGTFNKGVTNWAGYFGDTSGNVKTKYITFK